MTPNTMLACIIAAIGVASGQIMIKAGSQVWASAGTIFDLRVWAWVLSAFALYGFSSIGWLYILRQVPLSSAYPFLSLTFIVVPLGGYVFFSERLSWYDALASLAIVGGICISAFGRS